MARMRPTGDSRALVLDAVRAAGAISRVQIADETGLTQATVSTLVRTLIDNGDILETGERTSTRGKPRVLLALNPRANSAIGVHLGADWIVVVVVDATGAILARTRIRGARGEGPPRTVERIVTAVRELLTTAGLEQTRPLGVGITTPGLLDVESGVILRSRSLPGWAGFPIRDGLSTALSLPAALENDATAAAVGDYWGGGTPDSSVHCCLLMGATIGAGFVLDGTPFRGASSNTGSIGSLHVHRGDLWRGRTIDELASPRAVAERARSTVAMGARTSIRLSEEGDWFRDFTAVATAAVHGDEIARSLLEESAAHLGDGVLAIVNLLDLDSLMLAGPGFAVAGTIYLEHLQQRLDAEAFAAERHPVHVRLSPLVADAAAVGAASLVLQQTLTPR